MTRVRTLTLVVLSVAALGLTACSNSSSSPTTTAGSSSPNPSGSTTPASGAPAAIPAADLSPAGTAGTAPTVTVPSGKPPSALEVADLITGTGPAAKPGDVVTVQYVLATYSSDKTIQSSWTGQPFTFTLDARPEQVIPGWDQGVAGMQVGGRRELIIPPALGYGAQSPGAGISANDTLVFVVDLLKIN
jgi:peptidylprolyl isomerase